MNSKQSLILWLGIALIVLNLVRDWAAVKGVLSAGPGSSGSSGSHGGGWPSWLNPLKWITSPWNPVSHGIL